VIAEQVHRLAVRQPIPDQEIDHLSAVQPTIDVIAEVDYHLVGAWRQQSRVIRDQAMHLLQQVDATVDVAHGVYAHARRHPRRLACRERCGGKFVRPSAEQAAQQDATRSGPGDPPD
jgi:hypothetical protein